jgi:transcription elongation GreA/GreB family factor
MSAPQAFAARYLTAPIARFLQRFPRVRVTLHLASRGGVPHEDGIDLALVLEEPRPTPAADVHVLASDRLVLCAAPSYLRVHGVPWNPEDLVHHDLLARGTATRLRFRAEGKAQVLFGEGARLSADEDAFLREAALAGLGIAAVPVSLVVEALDDGSLVVVLDGEVDGDLALVAITPPGPSLRPETRALLELLQAEWRTPPWSSALLGEDDPGEIEPDALPASTGRDAENAARARRAQRRAHAGAPDLTVHPADARRLAIVAKLFEALDPQATSRLRQTLGAARREGDPDALRDVVVMNACVVLQEAPAERREVTIVYPWEAASERGLVSVLSPIGEAVLGLRVGAAVSVPSGHGRPRTFRVVSVRAGSRDRT